MNKRFLLFFCEYVTQRKGVFLIWYLMYCPKGNEEEIIASCKANIKKEILQDIFTMTCSRMKRYQGMWHQESCSLFPNYIFLESSEKDVLSRELEAHQENARIQEQPDGLFCINPAEQDFLHSLSDANHHIGMSRGYIKNGQTFITEGPLVGREAHIRHIDRHKRLAKLQLPIDNRQIQVGLEIYAKD